MADFCAAQATFTFEKRSVANVPGLWDKLTQILHDYEALEDDVVTLEDVSVDQALLTIELPCEQRTQTEMSAVHEIIHGLAPYATHAFHLVSENPDDGEDSIILGPEDAQVEELVRFASQKAQETAGSAIVRNKVAQRLKWAEPHIAEETAQLVKQLRFFRNHVPKALLCAAEEYQEATKHLL